MSDVLSTGVGLVATAIGVGLGWAALDVVMFVLGRAITAPGPTRPGLFSLLYLRNGAKATVSRVWS